MYLHHTGLVRVASEAPVSIDDVRAAEHFVRVMGERSSREDATEHDFELFVAACESLAGTLERYEAGLET